ncbi:hypothetical protein TWF481_006579 [Arthrobotrys musiformis]|uniref:F-box domain-containing protein n=1 Tax=Arthrobotrys musiformis TaxID=47236 RepID=A0AAV9WAF4_9PEZI
MDDVILRLIIGKLLDNQLLSVKFACATSLKTLALVLDRQRSITELSLGDIGSHSDLVEGFYIPPAFFRAAEMRLTTLEVFNVMKEAAPTLLSIIHQNSATLRRLKLGNPHHQVFPRFPAWAADADDLISSEVPHQNLDFTEINLPALEQLHIIHDTQFRSLAMILGKMIAGCERLTRIRLSGCTDSNKLVRRLFDAGARHIESLQICECDRRFVAINLTKQDGEPEFYLSSTNSEVPAGEVTCTSLRYNLPRMESVHTLQLTGYRHLNDDMAETYSFVDKKKIRRLWVGCQAPQRDPMECPTTAGLLRDSVLFASTMLSRHNWECLQELAIPNPSLLIVKLLYLKPLRVLRLLGWKPTHTDYQVWLSSQCKDVLAANEINVFLTTLSEPPVHRAPSVRLIVIDKRSCSNYCSRLTSPKPCYLAVSFDRVSVNNPLRGDRSTTLFPPHVKPVDLETALTISQLQGFSTYLLSNGPPSPERFWEDAYAFPKERY